MKKLVFLALGLLTALRAQEAPRASTSPMHFRWSETQAHELDYGSTIRNSPQISLPDKQALIKVLVRQLKRDDSLVEDLTEGQVQTLAEETRIEFVDLNGDGKPEIIAEANSLGPCGGTGDCIFWIFEQTADGPKLLLNTNDRSPVTFEKILVRPWSTNGYRDIVLGSHSDASSRNLVWFKFLRGAYRIHACYYSTRLGEDGQTLHTPAIWPVKCSNSLGQLR